MRSRVLPALAVVAGAAALAACGSSSSSSSNSTGSTTAASCAVDQLALVHKGQLTVGTDQPAYPPWFVDNAPSNGKGYESAVAYAIAKQMGFTPAQLKWVKVTFNVAISPAVKNFDFDVNQVSISDKRRKAVDFSSGYYDVRQAVISYKGSKLDGVHTLAGVAAAHLGAQVGTTSYQAIVDQIKPKSAPAVFDSNDLAVQALKNHAIDGIVVDVPTAFYMVAAQVDHGIIVGQLPKAGGQQEQFGAVLDKGSKLTPCVTKAVDALRANGTLDRLQTRWLSSQGAPELK